ncbi:hypothetical protein ACA910_013980 [Epithemia clementina (nom. ined.)]
MDNGNDSNNNKYANSWGDDAWKTNHSMYDPSNQKMPTKPYNFMGNDVWKRSSNHNGMDNKNNDNKFANSWGDNAWKTDNSMYDPSNQKSPTKSDVMGDVAWKHSDHDGMNYKKRDKPTGERNHDTTMQKLVAPALKSTNSTTIQ